MRASLRTGIIAVLFAVALSVEALAATATIEGVVRDSQTGDGLPGANVILVGTSIGASTDINGKYTLRNVPAGSYTIRATYIGYTTVTAPLEVADDATSLRHDFKLEAVALQVDGGLVVGLVDYSSGDR